MPLQDAPGHHTPEFLIDESGMKLGVELLTNLTIDYMKMPLINKQDKALKICQ